MSPNPNFEGGYMSSTFLNLSTDNTLGGNGASDSLIPSQAAVKHYADTKQTALVSGNNIKTLNGESLLGSGNITIESSSTPNVDGTTISYNSDSALQTIAVMNKNGNVVLPIWQGTEQEWNQGVATTWYNWKSPDTASCVSGGSAPSSSAWVSIAYGDGVFVTTSDNSSNGAAYTENDGTSWSSSTLPSNGNARWQTVAFGDGNFVSICFNSNGAAYSEDKGKTWNTASMPTTGYWRSAAYGNGNFVAVVGSSSVDTDIGAYSEDKGKTWNSVTLPTTGKWYSIAFGDGRHIAVGYNSTKTIYTDDGGKTWSNGGALPSSSKWQSITFGNGVFFVIANSGRVGAYSTNKGASWTPVSLPGTTSNSNWYSVAYGDGKFVAIQYGKRAQYTDDNGATWNAFGGTAFSDNCRCIAYGNGKFISVQLNSTNTYIMTLSGLSCYTQTANPSFTSTVYSAPGVASQLTIRVIDTDNNRITLTDGNIYTYNSGGNLFTYTSIGETYPNWLCFINEVGVKMGNTLIASVQPTITTEVTSFSTDDEVPSAKSVYDAINS